MSGDKYNKRRKKILEELDCGKDLSIMELGICTTERALHMRNIRFSHM